MRRAGAPPGFVEIEAAGSKVVARADEVHEVSALVVRIARDLAPLEARRRKGDRPPREGRGGLIDVADPAASGLVVKRLLRGGMASKIGSDRHGHGRLLAEMRTHEEAAARGIPTSRLAWGVTVRSDRGATASILATRRIEECMTLGDAISDAPRGDASRREKRRRLAACGIAVRAAHDRGLDHADLNIGNILVCARPAPAVATAFVIDLGISILGPPLPGSRRAANLVRLLRSAEKHLGRHAHRARDAASFLHGYFAGEGGDPRAWRRSLLASIRRRLPSIAWHRAGWAISRAVASRRRPPRRR
ncbi:MAG: hypothetical protein HY049_00195 [Acidobacteria bacterium]|nr:hypothetical protein [Acidobacteriota bacterium]